MTLMSGALREEHYCTMPVAKGHLHVVNMCVQEFNLAVNSEG